MNRDETPDEQAKTQQDAGTTNDPVIDSTEIFQGAKEVLIRHGDDVYRLIITRNNKLILNR